MRVPRLAGARAEVIDGRAQRAALERELIARRGFAEFVRRAWPIVEPSTPLIWSWHLEEMCAHAEAITPNHREADGSWAKPRIKNLVVNIPPSHSKTVIWSIMWPAWVWTWRPEYRWMFASYEDGVSHDAAKKSYELVVGRWYRERWGSILKREKGAAQGDFYTRAGGRRVSTSVGGKGTGIHCHCFVVDDPVKAEAGRSIGADISAQLMKANAWHRDTVTTRTVDPENFCKVVIMQRIHENDLSQQCLDQGYEGLILPALYDAEKPCRTSIGGDRRTEEGEVLFPARFSRAVLDDMALTFLGWDGPVASAQLQQRPAPKGGLIFRQSTFQPFDLTAMPINRTHSALSIDCNFKKSDVNSDVGFAIGGIAQARMYIYDGRSLNIGFNETLEITLELIKLWRPSAIIVEDKALGPALIELMRKKFNNVIAIQPLDSKEARAHGANIYYQSGAVYHCNQMVGFAPKPNMSAGGRSGFETALTLFPRGAKKDVIDALTQLIWYLAQQDYSNLLGALDALEKEQGSIPNAFDGMFKLG